MKKSLLLTKRIGWVSILLALAACATGVPHAKTNIQAVEFLNPNIYHQASPVVLTIYQLKAATAFEQVNFFALNNNTQAVLANDLLDKQEIEVRPGQQQQLTINLSPSVNYIGVVAAFRNPDSAQWRQVKAVKPGKNQRVIIRLETQRVNIQ